MFVVTDDSSGPVTVTGRFSTKIRSFVPLWVTVMLLSWTCVFVSVRFTPLALSSGPASVIVLVVPLVFVAISATPPWSIGEPLSTPKPTRLGKVPGPVSVRLLPSILMSGTPEPSVNTPVSVPPKPEDSTLNVTVALVRSRRDPVVLE